MTLIMQVASDIDDLEAKGPGAIYIPQKPITPCIIMNCPGCGQRSAMDVYHKGSPKTPSPSWEISGDPDKLTLKPSINCVGCCKWHGYLTDGVFKHC